MPGGDLDPGALRVLSEQVRNLSDRFNEQKEAAAVVAKDVARNRDNVAGLRTDVEVLKKTTNTAEIGVLTSQIQAMDKQVQENRIGIAKVAAGITAAGGVGAAVAQLIQMVAGG